MRPQPCHGSLRVRLHGTGMNFTHTGTGTSSTWPVGVSFPDAESMLKTTTVSES